MTPADSERPDRAAFWSPLRLRPIRRLLLAQIPADLADWLDFVAFGALLAYGFGEGPVALALLVVAMGLPYVLIGPFAGVLVDRVDLRWAMILANAGRGLATGAVFFAVDIELVIALAFLKSTADSAFSPAKQAALASLTPRALLPAANGLSHAINQATKVAGPAFGGALFLIMAPRQVFLVNAAISAIALVLVLRLPAAMRAPAAAERRFWREIGDGFAHFRRTPALLVGLAGLSAGLFAIFLYDALIPLLTRSLALDETVFGLAIAAVGLGGVVGALLIAQVGEAARPLRQMALGALMSGLLFALVGHMAAGDLPASGWLLICLFALIGGTTSLMMVPYRVLLQRETPAALLGRVTAVGEAVSTMALLAGPPAGALLAGLGGLPLPFLAGGYATILVGLGLVLAVRRFRD
ncbi:MAG: MFS transporter [Azospirillaceae bacterium]